jgi:hypothetical protein
LFEIRLFRGSGPVRWCHVCRQWWTLFGTRSRFVCL